MFIEKMKGGLESNEVKKISKQKALTLVKEKKTLTQVYISNPYKAINTK